MGAYYLFGIVRIFILISFVLLCFLFGFVFVLSPWCVPIRAVPREIGDRGEIIIIIIILLALHINCNKKNINKIFILGN